VKDLAAADQRPHTLVGENLQQQCVLDAPVDDMHAAHSTARRIQGRGDLRQHATVDGTVGEQRVDFFRCEPGEQLALLVEHAGGIGEQDQLLCLQHFGELACDQVGIDIEARSIWSQAERSDDREIAEIDHIQRLVEQIEARRIELGKTSGFEKLYARVTKLYFGGMARHLHELTSVLKPGAKLAYVVGDQASYLQVMIRTGQLLADIAERQGYEVERIDLFRTRFATATQQELREEVVVLKWPGTLLHLKSSTYNSGNHRSN